MRHIAITLLCCLPVYALPIHQVVLPTTIDSSYWVDGNAIFIVVVESVSDGVLLLPRGIDVEVNNDIIIVSNRSLNNIVIEVAQGDFIDGQNSLQLTIGSDVWLFRYLDITTDGLNFVWSRLAVCGEIFQDGFESGSSNNWGLGSESLGFLELKLVVD